jgi:hypothetical protein
VTAAELRFRLVFPSLVVLLAAAPVFAGSPPEPKASPQAQTLLLAGQGSLKVFDRLPMVLRDQIEARNAAPPDDRRMRWEHVATDAALAPDYARYSSGRATVEAYEANQDLPPLAMAMVMEREYGAGSMLSRSALALAKWADFYETRAQVPLDKVNGATETVADKAADLLHLPHFPMLNLHSEVTTRGISLGTRHRW